MLDPSADPRQQQQQHLETLGQIRDLMAESTRFLSLSGLSGVWAGACALVGAWLAHGRLHGDRGYGHADLENLRDAAQDPAAADATTRYLVAVALGVLVVALTGGIFFTTRKAQLAGKTVWNRASRRLLGALAVPLAAGGVFCAALLWHRLPGLVAPATLVFYGLALVGAARLTVRDVRSLGLCQVALGLVGCFRPGFSLELWAVGFGLLHVVYGGLMWWKYERA